MRLLAICCLIAALFPALSAADEPTGDYPRRALVVQVQHYLYLDPLIAPTPQRNRDSIDRLAASLRIPNSKANRQLVVLSDSLPPADERPPTRSAILDVARRFCETSRSQDRVLVYFRGHAFERNGAAYFAPVEGDISELKTLIPVSEIYDLLKTCKATQKVAIWDVCPGNLERSPFRPSAGAMTLELLVALATAPRGVEVVVPCLPSEYSLEYTTPRGDGGSAFFDAMSKGCEEFTAGKKPDFDDPLTIQEALPNIEKALAGGTKALNRRQTPKVLGKRPVELAPHDPKEAAPPAVIIAAPSQVSVVPVRVILQELALPSLILGEGADPVPALPCDPAVLKFYRADLSTDDILSDGEKYPLRVAVLRALQTVRETMHSYGPRDVKPLVTVPFPIKDSTKKQVVDAQAPVAVAITRLEEEVTALEAVDKYRGNEPRRWQAHYDYTLAQARLRLALLNEYNLALGHVRTESLPELGEAMKAWRLSHTEKMLSKKTNQELANSARSALEAIIAANKGTPWEWLAKRAQQTPPGLRWEPVER